MTRAAGSGPRPARRRQGRAKPAVWRDASERAAALGLLEWLERCREMAAASGNAATAAICAAAVRAARAELARYETASPRTSALMAGSLPEQDRAGARARGLGEAVRALRRERGMSQQALAAAAGVHRLHVGKIERGRVNPTWTVVVAIAEALEVDIAALAARSAAER
jgi:XRE family transcriptional regulator, regulator of sulfur utilization